MPAFLRKYWKSREAEKAVTPGLSELFLFSRLFRRCGRRSGRIDGLGLSLVRPVHSLFEPAHAFAHATHEFRNLAPAEKYQDHHEDDQPVHWKFHIASSR